MAQWPVARGLGEAQNRFVSQVVVPQDIPVQLHPDDGETEGQDAPNARREPHPKWAEIVWVGASNSSDDQDTRERQNVPAISLRLVGFPQYLHLPWPLALAP